MNTIADTPLTQPMPLDLDSVRIDPKWALMVPASYALRRQVLPLCELDGVVIVACARCDDPTLHKALRGYLNHEFQCLQAEQEPLRRVLERVYDLPSLGDSGSAVRSELPSVESGDAVAVCDELLQAARLRGASDIHLIPNEHGLTVQLRVDGQLEFYRDLPASVQPGVVSRIKVLAGMDIAEKRVAQDGRITSLVGRGRSKLEMRVASLPTRYGERLTLRLLTTSGSKLSLDALGMRQRDLQTFQSATSRPHGLVLLTGPTGSGKSTTLYVAIEEFLHRRGGNVITIEDPIEYEICGASQVEVDSADKVNFSKALRSVLRHDPDVVMIGEIRDSETASTALKAALTGHLVFSTVHTNTAAGVVTRLKDLQIEPFLIAACLRLSVAQRLVRRLCASCRRPRTMSALEAKFFQDSSLEGQTVYDADGCLACAGRGYNGRVALFEMLDSNATMANLIAHGAFEDQLLEQARKQGASTLAEDGLAKVLDGVTTVAEITNTLAEW